MCIVHYSVIQTQLTYGKHPGNIINFCAKHTSLSRPKTHNTNQPNNQPTTCERTQQLHFHYFPLLLLLLVFLCLKLARAVIATDE